jgi:hypothetical protein
MADFEIQDPKTGRKYRVTAPEGTTQQQALDHYRPLIESGQIPEAGGPPQDDSYLGRAAALVDPGPFIKGVGHFLGAAPQGVLGIPESIYQYAEHLPAAIAPPRPTGTIPDLLRRYRDWSDSTAAGQAGEVAGNIGAFIGGGELLDALGLASKVPFATWAARNPRTATTLSSAVQSATAQPVKGDDFWTERGEQFGLGAILGRILGRPVQRAAHEDVVAANKAAQEAHATTREQDERANQAAAAEAKRRYDEDVENTRRSNEAFAASAAEGTAADKAAIDARNKAAAEAHAQTVATEKEQHQALSEAQQAYHTGEREKAQTAARELSRRKDEAVDALGARREAKRDIPAQTTQGWWQRTGARIGESVPTDARADTGAHVQNAVAGRLNALTDRMNLDPDSAGLKDQLQTIRRATSDRLQKQNRGGFYTEEAQAAPPGRLYDVTGKLMPTTAGAPPPKVSGEWVNQVLNPLEKGPLTGPELTKYISRLGDKANDLATEARRTSPGNPERADLLAQADAYRQAQDTVIGHAAGGNAADKLALEQARQAYMMWGVGNDAAKASRGGVASPSQLIDMMTKRLGEARYKQALINPESPFHDELNWLQEQQRALAERLPSERQTRRSLGEAPDIPPARPTPIPGPRPRRAPTAEEPPPPRQPRIDNPPNPADYRPRVIPEERPPVDREPPTKPHYPHHNIRGAATGAGVASILASMGHPVGAGVAALHALDRLIGSGGASGGETSLENFLRTRLQNNPRLARAVRRSGGPVASTTQRNTSLKGTLEQAAKIPRYLNYYWPRGGQ